MEGNILQHGHGASGSAYLDGAVAFAGGSAFLSHRIHDAFAVVDVGAPDVEVLYENRRIGRTSADGKLLVPGLRSYQTNRISSTPPRCPSTPKFP